MQNYRLLQGNVFRFFTRKILIYLEGDGTMKKLDIVFLSSLVTFFLFITLVYSTSQGAELSRRIDKEPTAVMSVGSPQNPFFR
jgi:hypothetical protein